jgi:hypothetical protein
MRLSRETNPGPPAMQMQRAIRTAVLTEIRNLGLYYYMVTYVLRPFYCLFIHDKILRR